MLHAMVYAASVSGSLNDPLGASPLVAAVLWLQNTLLGTIATTVAVIAVASVGVMMLTGRVELRRGATVIVGCFILFGATSIAAGIRSATSGFGGSSYEPPQIAASSGVVLPAQPKANYDPYAGASVPRR